MDILIELLSKLADEAFAFAFPKVRDAVGLNPQKFAFRMILIRSVKDFLPRYSLLIKVLKNAKIILVLDKEFSKFLTHDQTPDLTTIVNIVKDAQQSGEPIPDDVTLQEAIRGWVEWIENAVKEDSELRDIVTLRGVESIERGMDYVQRSAERLHKDMVGDPESKIIPTTNYFKGLGIDQFAGRGWIETEIGKFLEDNDRGYLTIEADAGLGKTTFLAALVEKSKQEGKNYIHQFCALTSDNTLSAIQNIAAQLILRYELQNFHLTEIHDLFNVIHAAAEQRKEDEKIVIVVDALDETGVEDNRYNLKLPRFIPEGVYLIVSIRAGYPLLDIVSFIPSKEIQILAENENNLNDIRIYLYHQFSVDPIKTLQVKSGKSRQFWIDTLIEKSEGNWMYITMALQEVRENNKLDLNALPKGLMRYYLQNYRKWKAKAVDWENELRILSTLAAVNQGITLEQVWRWGILELPEKEIKKILDKAGWKSIVRERGGESDKEKRCQFIHNSLVDFFRGNWVPSSDSESKHHEVLIKYAQFIHSRIADYYLTLWGRFENRLSGLKIRGVRFIDQGYGTRSLLYHLEMAERYDDIHWLLKLEWVSGERRENAWYSARREDGDVREYTRDIQQAWRLADQGIQKNQPSKFNLTGLQVRYALILSSLNSISTKIPPPLIAALVEKNVWPPELALSHVRLIPDSYKREEALIHLIPTLTEENLEDALEITFDLMDQNVTEAFTRLAPRLSNRKGLVRKSWEKICKLDGAIRRRAINEGILALAPVLPTEYHEEALGLLLESKVGIDDEFFLVITPKLSMKLLVEVRKFYKNDQSEIHLPVMVDLAIAARYSGQRRETEITRAINGLAEVENWQWKYRLHDLAVLQNNLKIPLSQDILMKIFHRFSNLEDESDRVMALIGLYPFLTPEDRQQALSVSLRSIQDINQESDLVSRIEDVMPLLASSDLPGMLDLSKRKLPADLHIAVLHAAATHHPNLDLSEWVAEVWERIRKETPLAVEPAVQIIPYLQRSQALKILSLIKQMYKAEDQVKVLTALIPVLPERSYKKVYAFIEGLSSYHKAEPLSVLGQHIRFENPLFEKVFEWSEFFQHHCDYLLLLSSLIPRMPDESRREPLVKALHAFLNAPTRHYTEEQRDTLERSFKALIPFLTDDLYDLAINKLENYYDRQFQIAILIPHVQQAHLVILVKILTNWGYLPIISMRVLRALLERPDVSAELLVEMLKIYECINDQNDQSDLQAKQKAIVGSGAFLPAGLTEEVLTEAKTLSDENRWWLLANYLPGLREAEKMQETWIEEIGQVLREEIEPGETQLDFYTKLVPNLSKKNLAKLIEMVSAMSGVISFPRNYEAERIICALVPFLPHGVIRRVIIHQNIDYQLHIKARAQLIPFLEGEELCTVVDSEIDALIATKDSQIFPDLIPYIPEDERDQQVRRFLEILVKGREIGNSSYDYRTPYLFSSDEENYSPVEKVVHGRINYPSLKRILPSLSKSAITALFKHAEGLLENSGVRKMDGIVILACILPILPDSLLKRAIKVVNQIESRNSSILSIRPDWPTAEKRKHLMVHYINVLDEVKLLRDYCAPLLGQAILANYLPTDRKKLLTRILTEVGAEGGSLDRINTFQELANQLDHAALIQAFSTGAHYDSQRRAHYFYVFGQKISQIPSEVLYPEWENNLHHLSGRVRKDLLVDIFYLYPVIAALGGSDAVVETLHALLDVGAWWY